MKISSLNTLVNISSVWQLIFATLRKESTGSKVIKETSINCTKALFAFSLF